MKPKRSASLVRLFIFVVGLATFLFGVASNFPKIPMPIDTRAITLTISTTVFTLDVVLMVVGVFLIGIAWFFGRLAQ